MLVYICAARASAPRGANGVAHADPDKGHEIIGSRATEVILSLYTSCPSCVCVS